MIPPYGYAELNGRLIKDVIEEQTMAPASYILNAGGLIEVNQLVTSSKHKNEGAKSINEYVPIRIQNRTRKPINIRKGTIMATAEPINEESLNSMTRFTMKEVVHNYAILAALYSTDTQDNNSNLKGTPVATVQDIKESIYTNEKSCFTGVTQPNEEQGAREVEGEGCKAEIIVIQSTSDTVIVGETGVGVTQHACEPEITQVGGGGGLPEIMETQNNLLAQATSQQEVEGLINPWEIDRDKGTKVGPDIVFEAGHHSLHQNNPWVRKRGEPEGDNAEIMQFPKGESSWEHNLPQYPETCKAVEGKGQLEGGQGRAPLVQGSMTLDSHPPGFAHRPAKAVSKLTVSEMRQEVLSYLCYIQSRESIQAQVQESKSDLKMKEEVGGDSTHNSIPERGNLKEEEYLKQNLNKNEGLINEINCTREIHSMVEKAICTESQKKELEELFLEHKERFLPAFSKEFPAGSSFFIPHKIELAQADPIWIPQFHQSMKERQIIKEATMAMAKQGVIERSTSPWNSPAMCVPKKDGTWRPVINYREVNKVTIKEQWPITRADKAFDALSKAKYMSVVDCTSGYWQIPLDPDSRKYTAFTDITGRWQYTSLPMGITNAAPTFQKNMEIMLSGLLWNSCIVYIDDIIIYQ